MPDFQAVVTLIFIAFSYAILAVGIWGSIPVVTAPAVVGVAMGVAVGLQALASGLLLLLTGILLDRSALSHSGSWQVFFIFQACCGAVAFLLSGLSIYFDRKNSDRPLRVQHRHSIPSVVMEMNPAAIDGVGEATPLMEDIRRKSYSAEDEQ